MLALNYAQSPFPAPVPLSRCWVHYPAAASFQLPGLSVQGSSGIAPGPSLLIAHMEGGLDVPGSLLKPDVTNRGIGHHALQPLNQHWAPVPPCLQQSQHRSEFSLFM